VAVAGSGNDRRVGVQRGVDAIQRQWTVGGKDLAGRSRPAFEGLIEGDIVGDEIVGGTVVPVVDEADERRPGCVQRVVRRDGDWRHEAVVVDHLEQSSREQPHRRVDHVDAVYGIGGLTAVAVWSELGDCRRVSRSDQAVRHTGLDVNVDSSDLRRAGGYLSRQGPPVLRWALVEAAINASHLRSPDHTYYSAVKKRHDGKLAAISVARQLARRCYHILRNLDPDVVYAMPA
jgi:transposase